VKRGRHLLVDISAHGYGHVSQTAAVVNELAAAMPELRITLRSTVSKIFLKSRFQCEYQHIATSFDFGMKMASAVEVQREQSAAAYAEFHHNWPEKVAHEAQVMRDLKPDLLLANVPYLSLAAAQRAGVRSVAMCCLNWADIYAHYCVKDAASQKIHGEIHDAYLAAEYFLKLQPAMAMSSLTNAVNISPVASLGSTQRARIAQQGRLQPGEKIVMIAMGGIDFRLSMQNWRTIPKVHWIVPQAWGINREDTTSIESLNLPFVDVLATCDAIIAKPGYGTFAEAACAGIPVLYVTRSDWPEEPYLVQWMAQHAVIKEVELNTLHAGKLDSALNQLWASKPGIPPAATGAIEAAQFIQDKFFQV
jgi:hypothetical protein